MNVLEKILEEMLNYERVVKTDEDLEWNRAMYRCSEIIRSHMVEKEKVSSAEIISRNIDGKPYYEIKYKKVGEDYYTVGYSSYTLDYVVNWLNECFEFCGEAKVSIGYGKDTNVPSNEGWISVEERLPEDERMVLVTCQTKKGIRSTNRAYYDGAFWHGSGSMSSVTAWQPLPDPYKPK
ncbi:DUF551 domain-containing protein [Mediterraneibacter glycyrrhizinilyticus]|uniref:DUF551 domain-containing protein n=1 Tax=Mediterraneibacter glycyrrhizinilyticus TaxID=342942 RepID=UPI001D0694DF|nr:DUF551 domain-containing protein [Mediterraneibacter glycyrrhizinilyticus]MCB6310321.1 DUF551 domain-containing protein [Lachnospiraceae bacterium 210521-DFI.1.109]MCB6427821.1 DUF551 domain-containing protein [Mediterraneibacter glycyrrhizinilyticus]